MKENKKYFNVQMFRVVASLGVLAVHMGQRLEVGGLIRKITDFGANGVYVFFIISGFVAFVSSEKYKFNVGCDRWHYYKMRFIRIMPLYYCVILYYFIMHTFVWRDVPLDGIGGLGWLRYIFFFNIFWGNIGATWTMNVFVLFYAVVPIIKMCVNSYLKSILVCCLFYFGKMYDIPYVTDTSIDSLYFFMLGVVIYYAYKENKEKVTMIILCILLMISYMVNVQDMIFVFCLVFCIIMIWSFRVEIFNEKLKEIMNRIDTYSYDLYLVHAIFIELIDKLKKYTGLNGLYLKMLILFIGIFGSCFGSILVHNLIERPLQKKMIEKNNSDWRREEKD